MSSKSAFVGPIRLAIIAVVAIIALFTASTAINNTTASRADGSTRASAAVVSGPAGIANVATTRSLDDEKYVPGEVLVSFDKDVTAADRGAARRKLGATLKRATKTGARIELLSLPRDLSVKQASTALERIDGVRVAEPNYLTHTTAIPDDPSFGNQWGLNNTGQSIQGVSGSVDADIDAPEAWNAITGSSAVKVAIVDTGIDLDHPDLASSLWVNPGESGGGKETNGVDDDGNGYIDDYRGWNFVADNGNPDDDNGHGTHVAGIAAARGNNGVGVSGVTRNATLINIKTQDSGGGGNNGDLAFAIDYAAGAGARVASFSIIGGHTRIFKDVVDSHPEMLFVAAAGNDLSDISIYGGDPCAVASPHVICVAASTSTDALASFSNWSATNVDLAAPGYDIFSTTFDGGYGYKSGTSMATPMVTGAAALLVASRPAATPRQLKDAIMRGVDKKPAFTGKLVSEGRLNVANSLAILNPGTTSKASILEAKLSFDAAAGKDNALTVTMASGKYSLSDTSGVVAGTGCTASSATKVTCPSSGITLMSIDLDDGNDVFANSTATASSIDGGSGNDTLTGGTGADTLIGSAGADVLNGGTGVDTADYGTSLLALNITIDGTANDGASGENDNVKTDIENVNGGAIGDSITGSAAANMIDGGPGNNTISGLGGDDTLSAGFGSDDFTGGGGVDTASYASRETPVRATLNDSSDDGAGIVGIDSYLYSEFDNAHSDIENVTGGSGDDRITGTPVANRLDGGAGNDTFDGGLGADLINGGTGVDLISYTSRTVPITVTLNGTANDGQSGEADNVAVDVENVTTGSGNDSITGSSADNTFDGGTGADTLTGGTGLDTASYITRSASVSVSLDGTANDGESGENDNVSTDSENIWTGSGADTLAGSAPANSIVAGAGNDTIVAGAGNDSVSAGPGTDNLDGGTGDDVLDGGPGTDVFTLGGGSDIITYASYASAVNVSLDGAANDGAAGETENIPGGLKALVGGLGNDTLTGDNSDNVIDGYGGSDTVNGGGGNDELRGDEPMFPVYDVNGVLAYCTSSSSAGNDALDGGGGSDRLTGGMGSDVLHGGDNNDTLRDGWSGLPGCADGTTDSSADEVYGDTGIDIADYSASTTTVFATLDEIANDGGEMVDNLHSGIENLIGSSSFDYLVGDANANVINSGGNSSADVAEWLAGGDGNDRLIGVPGKADYFNGGNGSDTADFSNVTSSITVDLQLAGQQNTGGGGSDGLDSIENLIGTAVADTLTGSAADNTFDGGNGADIFNGLAGIDTVTYNNAARTAGVTADIDGAADDGSSADGNKKDNVKADIENLIGTVFGDTLTGSAGNNSLTGLAGVDILSGLAGNDAFDLKDGVNDGTANCGTGTDTVLADLLPFDVVDASCEPAGVTRM